MMKAHFEMFARYNAWANARVYAAASALSEADYRRDCGAFFGSVDRTLNHIMVGDLIWLARFRAQKGPPFGLDHILHEDRAELAAARKVLDDDILRFAAEETEESLAGEVTWQPITLPDPITQQRAPTIAHFFNHQTHHRGQVHALLTRLAGDAPPLDLIYFQRTA